MNAPAKLNVTVGQQVVFLPHTNHNTRPSFGWTVTRVSPSGKFEVTAGHDSSVVRYFNAQGYQVEGNMNGKVASWGARIDTDVTYWKDKSERTARQQVAASALKDVRVEDIRPTDSKEYMVEQVAKLEALLKAAKEAVDAI